MKKSKNKKLASTLLAMATLLGTKGTKAAPPTAAKDSGLASESKTKKAIPTWVKWLAGGAVGTSFLASGLVIGAIIHNNIMEEERKRNARIEKEKEEEEAKKRKEAKEKEEEEEKKERERQEEEEKERKRQKEEQTRMREERIRKEQEKEEEERRKWKEGMEEKRRNNQQKFLQNAKNFDDNISKIAIFLNNPIEELKKYIVAGTKDDEEIEKNLAFSEGYLRLVLEDFKTYIGMYNVIITNSKKQIICPVIGKIGKNGKPKNKCEFVDDKNKFILGGSLEIKVLSDKKFELKHNGLGLIFESHDLQLQKVEDEAAPVSC
jgi:outer membrane biosynthesis protein TonB